MGDTLFSDDVFIDMLISVLPPIQYIIGCIYFSLSHIDKFTISEESGDVSFNSIIAYPCRCNINKISYVIIMFTVSATVLTYITHPARNTYDAIIMTLARFIGYTCISMNTFIVIFIYWKHINAIQLYASLLNREEWTDTSVASLILNIISTRESIEITTTLLGDIISTISIVGSLITGIFMHQIEDLNFEWHVYLVVNLFIILQSSFLILIWRLSKNKQHIECVVRSNEFATRFIKRSIESKTRDVVKETATTIDWMVVNSILHEKWFEFYVLGIPLHNGKFIKQIVTFVGLFLVYAKFE